MEKLIVLISGALLAISASAQSKFEGVYGQAGVGYESVSPKYTASGSIGGVNLTGNTSISSPNSFNGTITLGFLASVTKDFLLGAGAEYSPIAGQKANYRAGAAGVTVYQGQYNKENSYNIFISPATPVGQDGLLYGKVGFTGATTKDTHEGGSDNTNYQGYSLGAGYKQIIQGGLYGFGEANYFKYDNQTKNANGVVSGVQWRTSTTTSANAFNIMAGIGYKF